MDRRQKTIHYSRVVHLSHVVHPSIPCWPGDPPVQLETAARWEQDGFFLQRLALGEHAGTHLNAPRHFDPDGMAVDGLPAEALVAPAAVIDISPEAAADPDYTVAPADILRWEERHGTIPGGSIAVLRTGWEHRWPDPGAFFNTGPDGRMHFPGFGVDAVAFLIEERRAKGFATDTHGIDPGYDETFAANRLALRHGCLVLENAANLGQLPPTGATLAIGVLRLAQGSGSPASVLAFIP